MSLSIGSGMMSLHLASCGCSGCAPMPVMRAVARSVMPASATDRSGAAASRPGEQEAPRSAGARELSTDEQRMVTELQARDREVRAHEAAHQAAGGSHVGAASYSYQQGPDGKQYAIGGEVPVDLSISGKDPAAIIAKMARVRAAALAPAEPSAQDLAVAAAASAMEAKARVAQHEEARREPDSASSTGAPDRAAGDSARTPPPGTTLGRALGAYRASQLDPGAPSPSQRA